MTSAEPVPHPLLTPELVALRWRAGIGGALDGAGAIVLLAAPGATAPFQVLAVAFAGVLAAMGLAVWGGPRRSLALVPWYGWAHGGIAALGVVAFVGGARSLPLAALVVAAGGVSTAVLSRYRSAGAALYRERDVEVRSWGGWTLERLAGAPPGVLGTIVHRGLGPVPGDLTGWEFRALRLHPVARLLGGTKATFGFFEALGTADVEGYHAGTHQDGEHTPWRTTGQTPRRFGYFVAAPADLPGRDRHPTATVLDCADSRRNPTGDQVRHQQIYVVMANSGNPDLLVGKAYAQLGRLRLPLGFLVLERWRRHDWRGAGP